MTKGRQAVPRPLKRTEYEIRFASRDAEKGWRDLIAFARNAVADAWDHLTRSPLEHSKRCYRLEGKLATVKINGVDLPRWQYKVTDGARIWYAVVKSDGGTGIVVLERVSPGHPDETDANKNHR